MPALVSLEDLQAVKDSQKETGMIRTMTSEAESKHAKDERNGSGVDQCVLCATQEAAAEESVRNLRVRGSDGAVYTLDGFLESWAASLPRTGKHSRVGYRVALILSFR
jgi:hypothetical protein